MCRAAWDCRQSVPISLRNITIVIAAMAMDPQTIQDQLVLMDVALRRVTSTVVSAQETSDDQNNPTVVQGSFIHGSRYACCLPTNVEPKDQPIGLQERCPRIPPKNDGESATETWIFFCSQWMKQWARKQMVLSPLLLHSAETRHAINVWPHDTAKLQSTQRAKRSAKSSTKLEE